MTYRGHIRNGQITLDEPAPLPEGAQVNVEIVQYASTREEFLRLPIERRRELLMEDSERVAAHYGADPQRDLWQGGDIVE